MGSDTDAVEDWATTRDGRRLFLERRGTGAPVVVFEAGMGASRNTWGAVVPAVAERTTTVAYDRSGLGRSPRDPASRGLARLTADAVDLLDHVGPGPFVLVGHSWGGPIARCVAAEAPERVAGLVLVDQSDEGCDLFFSKANERQIRFSTPLMPVAARLGLVRLGVNRLAASLPEPAASAMRGEDGTVAAVRALNAELAGSIDDLRRLRTYPPVPPEVPVTVITGTRSGRLERGRRPALLAAHRARAAALPQGRHVAAEASSHYVPFTEPELVAREILRIVDDVRAAAAH